MKTELALPRAFPAPRPRSVEVRETHISCVFLGDDHVFKIKKPVNLGFLDFRTLDARKRACDAEVTLNRRLAPEVYLGVVPVVRRRDGAFAFGGEGALVDWAVHMRRMRDALRADVRLSEGRLARESVDALARRLADFHRDAPCSDEIGEYGLPAAIKVNVTENFAQMRASIDEHLSAREAAEIETSQLEFLGTHSALFEARIAAGRVRDGHGDLRLEHVYVGPHGELTVLDCIEFNERFRFADVCADVAFLAMDLAWHGRTDLAERFLASYARASGDYDLYALVDFYESYRAYVRGKVATLSVRDGNLGEDARARARFEARRFFLLALASQRSALLRPILVCTGGVIASGKSTIARAIGDELSAPVIEADLTRKQLLGLEPTAHANDSAWTGAYSLETTERVYAEVLRRARVVLASGRPVVVDASFRSERMRGQARECARALGVPIRFVECRVPREVARERLARREAESVTSDGRLAIFDDFCARFEPMTELPPVEHIVVDAAQALEGSLAVVRAQVATWPRGLFA